MPNDLRAALERQAAPSPKRTVMDLIAQQAPQIEKALAGVLDTERFTRVVLTELQRNPKLYDCSPVSLLGGVMLSAQLGLEFGPLGHAYLVPYKREATFILGYKGMIALARRSGQLADIVARTVYEGDVFDYQLGTAEKLRHVPARPSERGQVVCYYGIARLRPTGQVVHVMYPEDIEEAKARSVAARAGAGPWLSDFDAMARKTVIRRMSAYLPMESGFVRAMDADDHPVRLAITGDVAIMGEDDEPDQTVGTASEGEDQSAS